MSLSILSVLEQLISVINSAYLTLVSLFWYYCVKYGLSPEYAYTMIIDPPGRFLNLYSYILGSVYSAVLEVVLVVATLLLIAKNSVGHYSSFVSSILRYAVSAALVIFSYRIADIILELSRYSYNYLWNYGKIDWYSIFSSLNTISWGSSQVGGLHPQGSLIEFIFLSGYFTSTLMLLLTLMIREALLYFLILVLPVFSVLITFKATQDLAIRLWKLFVETSLLPVFIMLALLSANIFSGYYLLQLAFLALASSMPILLAGGSRIFGASSLSSVFTMGSVGRIAESGASLAGRYAGAENLGIHKITAAAALPFGGTGKGSGGPVRTSGNKATNINWTKMMDDETSHRKKWINGKE